MSSLHLDAVSIAGFRGVADSLKLKLGSRLTIIYGGNASGKSSISQAIEFALSGQVVDHDDSQIEAHHLQNSLKKLQGRVELVLSNGDQIHADVGSARSSIEGRFREATDANWPDRQPVPITTTHVTTQGTLSRVLLKGSVTQNDLTGLCASPRMRQLLSRAIRLADHFRQAANGRNMLSSIRDAELVLENKKALLKSLNDSFGTVAPTEAEESAVIGQLARDVRVDDGLGIDEIHREIAQRHVHSEERLVALQRLLSRMSELGQLEAASESLQKQLQSSSESQRSLGQQLEVSKLRLDELVGRQRDAQAAIAKASEIIGGEEARQRASAQIAAYDGRLRSLREELALHDRRSTETAARLSECQSELKLRSDLVSSLTAEQKVCRQRLDAIDRSLSMLAQAPEALMAELKQSLRQTEADLKSATEEYRVLAAEVERTAAAEAVAREQVRQLSATGAKLLSAVSELKSLATGSSCTLCGHDHGTHEELIRAIDSLQASNTSSIAMHRGAFEDAQRINRDTWASLDAVKEKLDQCEGRIGKAAGALRQAESKRLEAASIVGSFLTTTEHANPVLEAELSVAKARTLDRLSVIDADLLVASTAEQALVDLRSQIEGEMGVHQGARSQSQALATDLEAQIGRLGSELPKQIPSDALLKARGEASRAELEIATLEQLKGRSIAEVSDLERRFSEAVAQESGTRRHFDIISGQLTALDEELKAIGATRDPSTLIGLEAAAREARDTAIVQAGLVQDAKQKLAKIEAYSAWVEADRAVSASSELLRSLRARQRRLTVRAQQFALLQTALEGAQSNVAQAVLGSIRVPIEIMFRAMTAGCPWDMRFALSKTGALKATLEGGEKESYPATAMLNSAYLNVAAIALRLALASQQSWTKLRTVVLDDPILELDSLTQGALLDGLEALISSKVEPWRDLQLVITTWSEDFAVLAAHKLAHLNEDGGGTGEEFVVYRLGSDPERGMLGERHVPRWKKQEAAA